MRRRDTAEETRSAKKPPREEKGGRLGGGGERLCLRSPGLISTGLGPEVTWEAYVAGQRDSNEVEAKMTYTDKIAQQ